MTTTKVGNNGSGVLVQSSPFLNGFKNCPHFGGNNSVQHWWNFEGAFDTDANGYCQTMGSVGPAAGQGNFTFIQYYLYPENWPSPGGTGTWFRPGDYIFLYDGGDGTETFTFGGDISGQSGGSGRFVLHVTTPTGLGMAINITKVGTAPNYIKNFRLVFQGTAFDGEALLATGEIFNPDYLNILQRNGIYYNHMRFMDWESTNGTMIQNWSSRSSPTFWTWGPEGSGNGVPYEVQIALCNKIHAHAWTCLPALANYDFNRRMADIFLNGFTDTSGHFWPPLNTNLNIYTEYYNEIWNGLNSQYPPAATMNSRGHDAFPNMVADGFAGRAYARMRSVQNGLIWKDVFGTQSSRIKHVLAGQSVNSGENVSMVQATPTNNGGGVGKSATFTGTISGGTNLTVSGVTGTVFQYQRIEGPGVVAGTYIESGSGTTWTISPSQPDLGPVAMTGQYWYVVGGNSAAGVVANKDGNGVFAASAYFGYSMLPAAWSADGDHGTGKTFQQLNNGGLLQGNAINAVSLNRHAIAAGSSTDSLLIEIASKTFNVATNLGFYPDDSFTATHNASGSTMSGMVTSYTDTTGVLVCNVLSRSGVPSSTANTIGTGTQTFTVGASLGFTNGTTIVVVANLTTTSTTSNTIATGTQTFTVGTGLGFTNGANIAISANLSVNVSSQIVTIGTGTKTFTVGAGLGFAAGMTIVADAYANNNMTGTVTSYSAGVLTLNITSVKGNGQFSVWTISTANNNMTGTITTYSGTTLTLSIISVNGSGTFTNWSISSRDNTMTGTVTSYVNVPPWTLTLNITSVTGSGTFSTWTIYGTFASWSITDNWRVAAVTSGQSLSDPPPNQTLLAINFGSQTSNGGPSLVVDGGTPKQLMSYNMLTSYGVGVTVRFIPGGGGGGTGLLPSTTLFVYTSQTASGTPTIIGWRQQDAQNTHGSIYEISDPVNGWIAQFTAPYVSVSPYFLPVVIYEGGNGFQSGSAAWGLDNDAGLMMQYVQQDSRMYSAYMSVLNNLAAQNVQLFSQFVDSQGWIKGGGYQFFWGAIPNMLDIAVPNRYKYDALFDFIGVPPVPGNQILMPQAML